MPISYYLQRNHVSKGPNDHSARVYSPYTHDMDVIVQKMMKRGTGTSETDLRASLQIFFDVVTDEVLEGNSIITPIANFKPGIMGLFEGRADTFDYNRHAIKANVSNGKLLNDKMYFATAEKINQPFPLPLLLEFTDINSGVSNKSITSNGMGSILGEQLKFNPENPEEGIFFVNGTTHKVNIVGTRTEGKLMFTIPTLTPGEYKLEVRKAYKGGAEVRAGALPETLTVS
jgi:hypothetical protein